MQDMTDLLQEFKFYPGGCEESWQDFYILGYDQNPCFRKLAQAPMQRTSQAEADWTSGQMKEGQKGVHRSWQFKNH